eukprot:831072-Amphidinium_carterae.1
MRVRYRCHDTLWVCSATHTLGYSVLCFPVAMTGRPPRSPGLPPAVCDWEARLQGLPLPHDTIQSKQNDYIAASSFVQGGITLGVS